MTAATTASPATISPMPAISSDEARLGVGVAVTTTTTGSAVGAWVGASVGATAVAVGGMEVALGKGV
jgi:hypothetical protein